MPYRRYANDTPRDFRLLVRHEPDGVAAGEFARLVRSSEHDVDASGDFSSRRPCPSQRQSRSIIYRATFSGSAKSRCFFSRCCGGRPDIARR